MAQQFTPATLGSMQGHVLLQRPGIEPTLVRDYLNQAVRWALDYKQTWAGTLKPIGIYVPDAVNTGTVSLTTGSKTVTLADSTWPVSDVVNTTLAAAVAEPGRDWVTLASIAGVDTDAVLVVDTAGAREPLKVFQMRASSILTDCDYAHAQSTAVTMSSLAGRQLRVSGHYITYTIERVDSTTTLTLTEPWRGPDVAGASYEIVKMYYSISPDVRAIIAIGDPRFGTVLKHDVAQAELNFRDPRRQSIGSPTVFAAIGAGPAGNMQHELWPTQRAELQLDALISVQWPDMMARNDTPPPFINPDVFVFKSLSMAKMYRKNKADEQYDPAAARSYEQQAREALQMASMADDAKLT